MRTPPDGRRAGWGVVADVLTGAVAVDVGQLVAGITGPADSPIVAVGQLQIDFTPPWLKNFAIREFGGHDKQILVGGILIVLALFAAVLGVLAMHRLRYGLAGLTVFGAVGVIAAATRPTATVGTVLPTLAAVAAAIITMLTLIRAARESLPASPPVDVRQDADRAGGTAATSALAPSSGSPALAQRPAAPSAGPIPGGAAAPGPPGGQPQLGRRRFLVVSGTAAGVAVVAGLGGRVLAERFSVASSLASLRLPAPAMRAPALPPGADLHIPGLSPFLTPNGAFYRVDTAIVLPQVAPASWRLRIHGMVTREITLNFDQLVRRPLIEDYISLCCVSNPVGGPYIGNALWLGAGLAGLLRDAGIRAGADQLLCTSADGFTSGVPVQAVMDGRDALLAVAMNHAALPVAHGFPVRMVVPGLYGYVSACKWLTDIEVTTYAAATAYWSAGRGWDKQAPVKTESRIDVPGSTALTAGRTAVAGVAWAQHKGIDAVEVAVDRGGWRQARLAAVPGIDTWRQWVWDWDATPGRHLIEARATDKTGYTQTPAQAPPEPNGATGYPSVTVTVS